MGILGEAQMRCLRIQRAGLDKIRAVALRDGVPAAQIGRDMKILRDVANGSMKQAAERSGVARSTVSWVVKKYEGYALEILGGIKNG